MAKTTDRDYRAEAKILAAQDFPFEVRRTEFDTFFISVNDLPGCTTEAETLDEAVALVEDAKVAWIAAALRSCQAIPAPHTDDDFSGKFVTRISRSTHRRVASAAKRDGVSLNAWVMEAINFRLGYVESRRNEPIMDEESFAAGQCDDIARTSTPLVRTELGYVAREGRGPYRKRKST